MSDLDKLVKTLLAKEGHDERQESLQKEKDQLLRGIKDKEVEKYKRLAEQLSDFLKKLKQVSESILEAYPDIFSASEYEILVDYEEVAPYKVDYKNLVENIKLSQKDVNSSLREIYDENIEKPSKKTAKTFAKGYNTLIWILVNLNVLAKDSLKASLAEAAAKFDKAHKEASGDIPKSLSKEMRKENELRHEKIYPTKHLREYKDLPVIPFAYQSVQADFDGENELFGPVLSWDLKKQNTLFLDVDGDSDDEVTDLIQNVMLRAVESYPSSAIKFAIFAPYNGVSYNRWGDFDGILRQDETLSSLFLRELASDNSKFEEILNREIKPTIQNRTTNLVGGVSISDFNEKNKEIAYPLIFLILDDYQREYYSSSNDALKYIFNNGGSKGVYSIVIKRTVRAGRVDRGSEDRYSYGHRGELQLPNEDAYIIRKKGHAAICEAGKEEYSLLPDVSYDFDRRLNDIKDDINDRLSKNFIPLQSLLEKTSRPKDDFSKNLSIPIGRASNSKIQNLIISTESADAHVSVYGQTGSGKSSLLQNIVLGGAYFYSPEELEFWILDFKDGSGLSQFRDLKHVKMMSIKNRRSDAEEIMKYIMKEKKDRADLFKGARDIQEYNKTAKKKCPRLLIIIDEFTQMPRDCLKILSDMAQQGRSYGMGLVLSSLNVDRSNEAIAQTGHRFEYVSNNIGYLFSVPVSDTNKSYLSGAKGNVLYNQGRNITEMRVAYGGSDRKQRELIAEINAKYPNYKRPYLIEAGSPERHFLKVNEAPINPDQSEKKISMTVGATPLGEKQNVELCYDTPSIIIFGDELRAADIEYSILNDVASIKGKSSYRAYYLDLNSNIDAEENSMQMFGEGNKKVFFAKSNREIARAIDDLYAEYLRRESAKKNEIGMPIVLSIHCAENLVSVASRLEEEAGEEEEEVSYFGNQDPDDDDLFAALSANTKKQEKKVSNLSYGDKLSILLSKGKNYRVYLLLHYEDESIDVNDRKLGFNTLSDKFNQFVVIPSIPASNEEESKETYSNESIRHYFNLIKVSMEENSDFQRQDFFYAYRVIDRKSTRFLPYEYNTNEEEKER